MRDAVGRHEREIPAARQSDGLGERGGGAGCGLVPHATDALVGEGLDALGRVLVNAALDEQEFKVTQGLAQDAVDRRRKMRCRAGRRQKDRDLGGFLRCRRSTPPRARLRP